MSPILKTASIVSLVGLSHLSYKIYNNKKEQIKIEQDEDFRDTSRAQNLSFGLKWGAQADMLVMEDLDSGDFIFSEHDCEKSTNFSDFFNCKKNRFFGKKYDTTIFVLRKRNDLKLIVEEYGKIKIMEYPVFISKINNNFVIVRELIKEKDIVDNQNFDKFIYDKSKEIFEEVEDKDFIERSLQDLVFFKFGLKEESYKGKDFLDIDFEDKFNYDKNFVVRNLLVQDDLF